MAGEVLAHFLTNFAGFAAAGGAGAAGAVALREVLSAAVYIVLFVAYGIYLLGAYKPNILHQNPQRCGPAFIFLRSGI